MKRNQPFGFLRGGAGGSSGGAGVSSDTASIQTIEWKCCFGEDLAQDRSDVENILPKGNKWKIKVESVNMANEEEVPNARREPNFEARIVVKGCQSIKYEDFLKDFYESSGGEFNKDHADQKNKGSRIEVSGRRKCFRNPRYQRELQIKPSEVGKRKGPFEQKGIERQPGKDTECESKLTFTVRKCKTDGIAQWVMVNSLCSFEILHNFVTIYKLLDDFCEAEFYGKNDVRKKVQNTLKSVPLLPPFPPLLLSSFPPFRGRV